MIFLLFRELKKLQVLILRDNRICDISPLSNLTELEVLYLSDNQISDISPLINLKEIYDSEFGW